MASCTWVLVGDYGALEITSKCVCVRTFLQSIQRPPQILQVVLDLK